MIADASMIEVSTVRRNVADAPRRHHAPARPAVRGGYDAAQTHAGNTKHWAQADSLSAGAALTPQVRATLRNRSRYESDNNSIASGVVKTLANDTIGTGPRLQLMTGDRKLNRRVEQGFHAWAREVGLASKLRTAKMAQVRDGEAFLLMGTNSRLRHDVRLDLRNIEAEQIADPSLSATVSESDGISFDPWGNPTSYSMLRSHPGGSSGEWLTADPVPAEFMVHYFNRLRAGQVRGLPEITPALPLFAMLRRYTLAVVTSAEIAADLAGVLQTNAVADDGGYDVDPLDTFEIVRGMFTSLPEGWQLNQLRAEQPTQTYGEFRDKLINEIARCLNMPFNVAACNSADYNYASGRLDHQVYHRSIFVDRSDINCVVLDRIWRAWLDEAALVESLLPQEMRTVNADAVPHAWYWDGFKHVDPDKESKGDERNLKTGSLTIPDMHAERGEDWEEQQEKQAKALGLPIEDYRARLADYLLGPDSKQQTAAEDAAAEAAEAALQEMIDA